MLDYREFKQRYVKTRSFAIKSCGVSLKRWYDSEYKDPRKWVKQYKYY